MEANHSENPQTAIIRLLKSQGCCPTESIAADPNLQQMQHYRDELRLQTSRERTKLSDIPCAITLSQEISELKEVINGLGRENSGRIDHLTRLQQRGGVRSGHESEHQAEH